MAAAWAKFEEYTARIALVLHYVRWAAHDFSLAEENRVDAASMQAAIHLTEWFKQEAKRVYVLFHESDEERELRRLAEWIERKGGAITPRDLQRLDRRYSEEGTAEEVLEALVQRTYGQWETFGTTPQGGRPSRRFVLYKPNAVDKT